MFFFGLNSKGISPKPAVQAIPAFEEAVAGMAAGGLRRIELPGTRPELSYARERSERFANELFGEGSKYRCAAGGAGGGLRPA